MKEIQNIVIVHLHDYKTGLSRGHTGTMLYLAEREEEEENQGQSADNERATTQASDQIKTPISKEGLTEDINALAKSKGKEKAKGYGKCWHCGGVGTSTERMSGMAQIAKQG